MKNSSYTLLVAIAAFLLFALLLPAPRGNPLSPSSLTFCPEALAAPSGTGEENDEEIDPFATSSKIEYAPDPLERMNRAFFVFNDKLYFWFLKPVAQVYSTFIPPGVRTCIRNGFDNLRFPCRFVNNVLQGKFRAAGIETGRFLINSTFGLAGLFEMAAREFDLAPPREEDTGQTLGFYGVKPGFYIVWPVFGPSTLRDSFGLAGDTALNPLFWYPEELWIGAVIRGGIIVNNTSLRIGEYEDFKKSALDPYISMRQAYLQNRENDILR